MSVCSAFGLLAMAAALSAQGQPPAQYPVELKVGDTAPAFALRDPTARFTSCRTTRARRSCWRGSPKRSPVVERPSATRSVRAGKPFATTTWPISWSASTRRKTTKRSPKKSRPTSHPSRSGQDGRQSLRRDSVGPSTGSPDGLALDVLHRSGRQDPRDRQERSRPPPPARRSSRS